MFVDIGVEIGGDTRVDIAGDLGVDMGGDIGVEVGREEDVEIESGTRVESAELIGREGEECLVDVEGIQLEGAEIG